MKKIWKLTALFLIMCLFVATITACNLFNTSGGLFEKNVDLSIYHGGEIQTLSVTCSFTADITPKYTTGKVLKGYYDNKDGEGIEYFDYKGIMNGPWMEHYPTTIYAVYEEIDYTYVLSSGIYANEDPDDIQGGGAIGSARTQYYEFDSVKKMTSQRAKYAQKVLEQNPYLSVEITAFAMLKSQYDYENKNETCSIEIVIGSEKLAEKQVAVRVDEWTSTKVSVVAKGLQVFGTKDIEIGVRYNMSGLNVPFALAKNIYFTMKFVG